MSKEIFNHSILTRRRRTKIRFFTTKQRYSSLLYRMKTIDETRYFLFCFFRHFFKFFSEILFYLLLRSYKTILTPKKLLKDNKQYFDEILCISLNQFKQISSLIFPKPHLVINLMFKILKVQRHELLNIFLNLRF